MSVHALDSVRVVDLYTVLFGLFVSEALNSIVIQPGDGGEIEPDPDSPLSGGEHQPIQNEQHRSGCFFLVHAVEVLVLLVLLWSISVLRSQLDPLLSVHSISL